MLRAVISFLFRLAHFSHLFWVFALSGTRCSVNKSESVNNNIYLTKSSDTFYSPDYHNQRSYPANMNCTWIISLPENKIKLSFSAFDLQAASPSCQDGDFVEVRDGEHLDSPILGTFCGSAIPKDVFSSGSLMLVKFRSDEAVEKRGFIASYYSYDTSNGFSIAAICVGVAVVLVILVAAVFGVFALKKRKSRSRGHVRVYKTKPGITIKVFPATPRENRSQESLNNDTDTQSSLAPGMVS